MSKLSAIALAVALAVGIGVSACASSSVHGIRFKNAPPVLEVSDRRPLAKAPRSRGFARTAYYFDRFFGTTRGAYC